MKFILGLICFIALSLSVNAQTAQPLINWYAAGVSWNQSATPAIAGTALYARLLDGNTGTYAFTNIDALPESVKPFTVTTNIGGGIAQKLFAFKVASKVINVYVPTAAGISFSGNNTGWQWNAGGLASIPVKNNFKLMPNVRFMKSSVSGGSGYQPIIGILVGWGQ